MNTLIIADEPTLITKKHEDIELLISLGNLSNNVIHKAISNNNIYNGIAVKGNYDDYDPFPKPVQDLHMDVKTIDGITFAGIAGCISYKRKGAFLYEQDIMSSLIEQLPYVDVIIAHNSPFGIHEKNQETHIGFIGLKNYIEEHQPKYCIHGHQHINKVSTIGATKIIGVMGEKILDIQ